MRTALFVAKPTKITIKAYSPADEQALLLPHGSVGITRAAIGTYELAAGVYAILTTDKLEISGQNVEVQHTIQSKDLFPDPPLNQAALTNTTLAAVQSFFASISKGEDVIG